LATLIECKTKIEDLEETVKELKQELRDFRKERNEQKEHISDRRFALKLMIWGVACGFISGMLSVLLQRMLGL
jgi:F0F1-type ATP synthase assembly protein I